MRKTRALAVAALASLCAFLLTAGLSATPMPLAAHRGDFFFDLVMRFAGGQRASLSYLVYGLCHMACFGAALPLWLAHWFRLSPYESVARKRFWIGCALLVLGLASGIAATGELAAFFNPPRPLWIAKAFYASFQYAMSMTVVCFFLVPETIRKVFGDKPGAAVLAMVAGALAAVATHYAETRLGGNPLPDALLIAIIPFAAGAVLTRTIYLTAIPVFLLYFPTIMPLRHYGEISWKPLQAAFLLMFCSGCIYLSSRSKRVFPPKQPLLGKPNPGSGDR